MKTVILALLVLVVVSQGEALRCYCGGMRRCTGSVETCSGFSMVCARVSIYAGTPGHFKGCMREVACLNMNRPGISSSSCCRSDQCN